MTLAYEKSPGIIIPTLLNEEGEHTCWCCDQETSPNRGAIVPVSYNPPDPVLGNYAHLFICHPCIRARCPFQFHDHCRVGC